MVRFLAHRLRHTLSYTLSSINVTRELWRSGMSLIFVSLQHQSTMLSRQFPIIAYGRQRTSAVYVTKAT